MKVLIASADKHWPAKAAASLRSAGVREVHLARTMEAGLDLLRTDGFTMVILSPDLPDRQGVQALEALRARYPHMPALLVHRTGAAPSPLDITELGKPLITTWEGLLEDPTDLLDGFVENQERRQYDDDRARSQELRHLHEIEELRTKFLNITAHELSTPLTPISMGLDLLEDEKHGALNDRQKDTVRMIARNIAWLEKTIQALRDASRLQERSLGIDRKETDLRTLVRSEVEALKAPLQEKRLQTDVALEDDLVVEVDRERIRQVVAYIIDNARRFTDEGGTIHIRARRVHDEAQVVIEDDGIGMNEEQIMGIFYPLAQLHDTTQETRSGTGLSLYLARGILEAHGGRIWAESDGEGRGSRFTFALPLVETSETDPHLETVDAFKPA